MVKKITPILCDIIVELHVIFADTEKVAAWLNTPNLNFGGMKPIQLIESGRHVKVMDFILLADRPEEIT